MRVTRVFKAINDEIDLLSSLKSAARSDMSANVSRYVYYCRCINTA